MVDTLSTSDRSRRMSLIRGKDTKPEMVVRRLVHSLGYRYRLHRRDLPGCPDLVFSARRKVIFVHGCFWHRHPDSTCKLARLPKSREEFWVPKLERNASRDRRNEQALKDQGWNVLVIWECETNNQGMLKRKIQAFFHDEID
ncbi:very short patch repair endonuclease [Sinorhizobium meliloti]|uniref:very short patch repair endonuclease n=1 Tax=Rhizobium meliloti TaxID=382 RepID=UPI000FD43E91|nr:DNA mismatch endonuclease Vsr [Sinorhizobium meliloti]RVM09367.1 DNA mismatch endonuclease Vsr [Sinorhizobium meliloti]RVM50005.1 DNA mismatch endonuclease Vsr [Sinorhizobium meliloti]RVM66788.1 DNA mismatch endonuclease Vsr [Sinorhizobium meliloti]RVM72981.1 DNA mismatch endonuclease Vsr [Sinorhizobium meliloti]RVM87625.1 DNA mismatch endonuclease Vsr [Sinorhizobium meliloti]